MNIKQYISNILYALDCLGSAMLGLDKNELISSVLGKLYIRNIYPIYPMVFLVDTVFFILLQEKNHSVISIQDDEGLYTDKYDGAISPKNVIKYVVPIQIFAVILFINLDLVLGFIL